jgi:transcriptional regulator of arginine metabolism
MDKQDKKARLQYIRTVIGNCAIENQEELSKELAKAGFATTQTMLSRDLKQLRISKVRTRSGKSVYALPGVVYFDPAKTREELNAAKWSLQFSGNIAVLHTPPGHASLVAYEIDEQKSVFFLGTVAGDDTVMIILAEDVNREQATTFLMDAVPQLRKRQQNVSKKEK